MANVRSQFVVFTANNYTVEGLAAMRAINGPRMVTRETAMTYIAFQQETGGAPNHTPHLQGYIQMAKKVAISSVTKFLSTILGTPVHTDEAMGSNEEANVYCQREFTEEDPLIRKRDLGTLPFSWGVMISHESKRRKEQGKRADLEAVKAAILEGASIDELTDMFFREFAMYGRFLTQYHTDFHQRAVRDEMSLSSASAQLRPWQTACLTICQQPASSRKVHWFWENVGNVGKSWMARYLALHHQAIVVGAMKKADLLHAISKMITGKSTVVFDLTRSTEEGAVKVVYEVLEQLSNRVIFSGKYDSQTVWIPQVHLICFANFAPDRLCMSEDRWDVHHIGVPTPGI
jgi:hypothetical protein